ncbi:hypothetical protein D5S18_09100 [Nocardia panacis]|uniref:HTH cro/C1-type domain-containing protein n=1 Tax=Nocardia panacis TaxID=2340916 RepID=A0A3A4KIM7_9NOCA|nr:hypothetical protein [Nocardia panacis]RJO76464.1 hypothetical protein D5S18_09100 [Nocardia panacis]
MVEVDWTGKDVLALRAAMRRSRSEFARLVGVTQRTVILWEKGRTARMHAASQRLLDRVLSEADSVVVARFERAITAGRSPAIDKEVEDDDVNRRELLACLGAGLAGPAAALLANEPEKMLAALDAGSIGERRLGLLEESAEALGRTVIRVPPHELLADTVEQFRTVRTILVDRQATHHQVRLVRTAGRLANVAGEILFNEGDFEHARRWYGTAMHAAQDIGDRSSEDFALAGLAYLPTYADKPREVLNLLAPRLAENPRRGAAAAWLWGMAARAHANLGDAAQFEHSISRSADALDGLPDSELPLGIFSYRREKLAFYRAIGYAQLGRAEETARAAADALAHYDPRETTEPALVRLEYATALLHAGEIEHACAVATEAITDAHTYLGLTVGKRAARFDDELGRRRGRAITEWRERARPALLPNRAAV